MPAAVCDTYQQYLCVWVM